MPGNSAVDQNKRATDLDLAKRCLAGDRAAQEQLFAEQRGTVHRVLFRIMGSNSEIEDLVQDTLIQVFRSLHNFRGDSSLSTWVARIATRVTFAHIKRRPPRAVALDLIAETDSGQPSPERHVVAERAVAELYRVLERLKPKYRVAYALHVIDGRSLAEVAEMIGASLVATKSRVWRARREVEAKAARSPLLSGYLDEQGALS